LIYHGKGVKILRVWVRYRVDKEFDIPRVGAQNIIGREFNIRWERYQNAMDRESIYHG